MKKGARMQRKNSVEIQNLGSIYKGPWEKKYWNSSRGKQRYPFPIGYSASRKQGDEIYHMRIEEGDAGPLFIVTCGENECRGPTPTSAWEAILKVQPSGAKKGSRGRSQPVNGAEMFGFSDTVVQYLLRDLHASPENHVPRNEANVEEEDDSFSYGASVIRDGNRKRVLIEKPNWPTLSKRSRASRKRNSSSHETKSDDEKHYVSDSEPETRSRSHSLELESVSQVPGDKQKTPVSSQKSGHLANDKDIVPESPATDVGKSPGTCIGSLGQEVTDCMLSLLLPSAMPLLSKRSRRKIELKPVAEVQTKVKILGNEQEISRGPDAATEQQAVEPETTPNDALQSKAETNVAGSQTEPSQEANRGSEDGKQLEPEQLEVKIDEKDEATSSQPSTGDEKLVTELENEGDQAENEENISKHERKLDEHEEWRQSELLAENLHREPEMREPDVEIEPEVNTGSLSANLREFSPTSRKVAMLDSLEPVAAFEHTLPVLCVMINVRNKELDLCVWCGPLEDAGLQLLVYRVSVTENLESNAKLLRVLQMKKVDESDDDSLLKLLVESGVRFTCDGEHLLALGCFCFAEDKRSCSLDSIRVISLVSNDLEVKLELQSDTRMRCILVTGATTFIAGGDGGCLKQWETDSNWSLASDEHSYPNGVRFTITTLLAVPSAPHLVLGSNADGFLALWDISSKQLLSSYHTSEYLFSTVHLVDVSLMNDSSFSGCVCLLARVASRAEEGSSFWTMAALEDKFLFIGSKLSDRILTAAPMGRYGVAGTSEGSVFLWDFSTGANVVQMFEQDSGIVQVETSLKHGVVVTLGRTGRVILYV